MTATDPEAREAMRMRIVETLDRCLTWGWVPSDVSPDHLYQCSCGASLVLVTTPDAAHRAHLADVLLGLWDGGGA